LANENQIKQLSELFEETGNAHHQAFFEVDGEDVEWPLWYAEYLQDKLPVLLGREFTKSELVYWLITMSNKQPVVSPDAHWPDFYAVYFLENYD
jgi:hypothetical protein